MFKWLFSPTKANSKERWAKVFLVMFLHSINGLFLAAGLIINPKAASMILLMMFVYILARQIEKSDWLSDYKGP